MKTVENLEEIFLQRWAWMNICDFAYANNQDSTYGIVFENATPFLPVKIT